MGDYINVLHIDDKPSFAELTATYLEKESDRFNVETVTSASEGLKRITDRPPDCVVSDYEMPGQDGIELLESVREEYPDLPFILYTGKGSEEVAAEAISAGVTDYLQKDTGTGQYTVLANRIRNAVSARQSAIEANRRRHRLEQILKTVPGCVVQLNADGQFVFANERAEEVFGLTSDELTDRSYNDPEWRICDPNGDPIPDEELPYRRVRDSGEPVRGLKHTIQWPDGTQKMLLVNGAPLFDENGAVDRVVFSLTDITDQETRERELERTRRRLELALETTDTGVWVHDIETDETIWNETLLQSLGLTSEEFEGTYEAFADRVHEADLPRIEEELTRAIESDSMYHTEFRMYDADGDIQWVEVRGRLIEDSKGKRVVGIHHEITDRKRRKQHIETMEQRIEAILQNTTVPMFMRDANGEYIFANRRFRELFNLGDQRIKGRTSEEILPEEATEWVQKDDQKVVTRGQPVETEDRIEIDGKERVFLLHKTPVSGIDERPGSNGTSTVFGVATDISEQKKREQKLQRQNKQLEEFTSIVSHDLRNPLNVAEGRVELARQETGCDHLDDAADAINRSLELIDDLLTLAREGKTLESPEAVTLSETVRACWQHVETDQATLDIEGDRVIQADRSRLRQLVENLLANAIEHGGSEATVCVGRLDDGFYVEDDGPGIPEHSREAVFETGYSTAENGNGFGLRVVREVVDAHGWEIAVTKSAQGGARFEVIGIEHME
jgi:PAS domain S-box-containing protein